jgi:hypothetical protein
MAFSGLVTRSAPAQVNVEPFRKQVADGGFGARVRASMASYAGNTRGVIFGSAGLVGLRTTRHFAFLALSGDYTRLDGTVSVAKWFGHARHAYELSSRVEWEEYGQIESDRFRRVTLRALAGTGPRVALLRRPGLEIHYGASYMYEHTNLDTAAPAGPGEGKAHRFSNYVSLWHEAHERIVLSSVTYAQPRFSRPADVTLLSVNGAEFVIVPRLRSRLDATLRYDSVTPADVHSADFELKSALELVF